MGQWQVPKAMARISTGCRAVGDHGTNAYSSTVSLPLNFSFSLFNVYKETFTSPVENFNRLGCQ